MTPGDSRMGKAIKGAGEGVVDLVHHNWDTHHHVGWKDCMQGRSGRVCAGSAAQKRNTHTTHMHAHTHIASIIVKT